MNRSTLYTWLALVLIPLIPVVLLYWFFQGQNYFELQDAAKGVVAVGPIAAYLVLVTVGYQIYSRTARTLVTMHPAAEDLPGAWQLRSTSSHGREFTGDCNIRLERGELSISGTFFEADKQVGTWTSRLAAIRDNQLYVFYGITELRDGRQLNLDGVCFLSLSEPPVRTMSGIWVVVGREAMSGRIVFEKKQ